MKVLLRVVAIVLVLLALAWAGVEYLLVRQVRQAEAEGRIVLGSSAMLADPARIGGRFTDVMVPLEWDRHLALSGIDLWVPVLALNTPHANLPARVSWGKPDYPSVARFDGGMVWGRISPFHGMALTAAGIETGGLRLDRDDIAGAVRIEARSTNFDTPTPRDVAAAYRVDLAIADLNLPAIASMSNIGEPSGEYPGSATITGPLVLGLSSLPKLRDPQQPEVIAVIFEGLRIEIDGAEMRIWGRLARDDSGQLSGEVALDSAQLRDFVTKLAHAGYIPVGFAPLTATALTTVAEAARQKEASVAQPATGSPDPHQHEGNPDIPPRPEGIDRIPLRIEAGQIHVGDLPLGALLARAQPAGL